MKPNRLGRVSTAALAIAAGASMAAADEASELAELRERVEVLEAELDDPGRPQLRFNIGENTEIQIYGFVRFEAAYDFNFAQGDATTASVIGDPAAETDGDFETSVRVSRLGVRSDTTTDIGQIKTELEFDLFSEDSATSSPDLRLRKAFINVNDRFLLGQQNSNFMPSIHYPRSVEFNGPVGLPFARVVQARYTHSANGFTFSGSIEEAAGSAEFPTGGSEDPLATAALLYNISDSASVRVAGLVGTFSEAGTQEQLDTNGIVLSGTFVPWQGGRFGATYTTGQALGNLLIGGGARSNGAGEENDSQSFSLELTQQVTEQVSVGVAYGNESYDFATPFDASIPGNGGYTDLQSVHLNVFYTPVERFTLAAEYVWIESEDDFTGRVDDGSRVGVSATFRF
ncbi:DcaP family trimeric outer membrane transporter [uncultured Tateyamaria sp.]|uniref:DcaP family trimeric outer membrane transporter n=1 Tax=uncultured Tateyamaria sp. TaxID=455651 RepID=UPI0026332E8C|nr:DcaP family trimeric outer membrane transporter [uncultured Tateyamaria sp.]